MFLTALCLFSAQCNDDSFDDSKSVIQAPHDLSNGTNLNDLELVVVLRAEDKEAYNQLIRLINQNSWDGQIETRTGLLYFSVESSESLSIRKSINNNLLLKGSEVSID